MNQQHFTIKACQFWNEESPYQDLHSVLNADIPESGKGPTPQLEMLRLFNNIYYQIYNNGNIQECYEEDLNELIKLTKKHGVKNDVIVLLKSLNNEYNGLCCQGPEEPPYWVKRHEFLEWERQALKDYDNEVAKAYNRMADDFTDEDHENALAFEQLGVDILLMKTPPPLPKSPPKRLMKN